MTITNVMRLLKQANIPFETSEYEVDESDLSGVHAAQMLGIDPDCMFKTLVTEGRSGAHYVFLVPVNRELNLKNAASAVGEKSIVMIKSKELLPLTGYIHGGCSPIGMKKPFPTVIDQSAAAFDTIFFSGGRIGFQIETSLEELKKVLSFRMEDVAGEIIEA